MLLDAAWHFSYFKSPEDIVVKYASVSWPRTEPPYSDPSFHRDNALRCVQPEHPNWQIRRVPRVVDVPGFALRNPCHMQALFAYKRADELPRFDFPGVPGYSNDTASDELLLAREAPHVARPAGLLSRLAALPVRYDTAEINPK